MENNTILDDNRCIYCGDIIPEGRQVCQSCEDTFVDGKIWKANETKGVFHEDHLYFTYDNKGSRCVDLTLLFGKGNEPTSMADEWFKNHPYHKYASDYNYGEPAEDKSIMKFLAKNLVVFYILSFTWGFITSFIGLLILLPLAFAKRVRRTNGRLYGVLPKTFGEGWGFEMGCFFFVSHDCEGDSKLHSHEMGHELQNILFGPLMLFIVNIPSAIRFWYRELKYYRKGEFPETRYDDIWFEGQATAWGARYITNLYDTAIWL